jgi:hypothetical protein
MGPAEKVARRFASQQLVTLVESKETGDIYRGYEDYEDAWKGTRKELAGYAKACERWAPLYRRISDAIMTPKIADYADLMDARVREIHEAELLCAKLVHQAKVLDQELKALEIPDETPDEQLTAMVTELPSYAPSVSTASSIEAIHRQWAAEDEHGYFDTSLEEYLFDGKLRSRLSRGALPSSLNDVVDLKTIAFGYLQGVLSPDTIREYAIEYDSEGDEPDA